MKVHTSRFLWVFLASAAVLGALWELYPLPDASRAIDELPRRGAGFQSQEFPLSASEAARLDEARAVKLVYEMAGHTFFMAVMDGTRNRNAVHDPLYCFRGRGAQVTKVEDLEVEGGKVRWLTMVEKGQVKNALFWFSDGDRRFPSMVEYWLRTTLRRLTFGLTGAEPVAVMIMPIGDGNIDRDLLLGNFMPLLGI